MVVQEIGSLPSTLHDWEHALTRALLCADDVNADPIRSFEITPETLASCCGLGIEYAANAEAAFRQAFQANISAVKRSLKQGRLKASSKNVPNSMAILSLSLLVDSLLDGEYQEIGQYRVKLAQWLGVDNSFSDLRGIHSMWEDLVIWLEERVSDGDAFRRLILPKIPEKWTHIGYTRYLSFPNKRDLRYLTKRLLANPHLVRDPAKLVRLLDAEVNSALVSPGLKIAFDEFKAALKLGAASVDHRFWKLISAASQQSGQAAAPACKLVMVYDEDGDRTYALSVEGQGSHKPRTLGLAAMSPDIQDSPNLGPAIRRGILFFRATGIAGWTASGEPLPGSGPFHVALADKHMQRAGGAIARFESSGNWHVTVEPVPASTVSDILRRIRVHTARETVRTVALIDGVRVGRAWLGFPRYLPHIDGGDGAIVIKGLGKPASSGLLWKDGKLSAALPVEGEYSISNGSGHWSRRATFVSEAEPHVELEGAAFSHELQKEWTVTANARSTVRSNRVDPQWDGFPYEYQDMIEAIYASARTGLGEGEIVNLVSRAVGNRCWEMVRSLQESTIVEARLRPHWRGRTFTLGRPTIHSLEIDNCPGIIVSGALPAKLEREFQETVKLQGGKPFRRFGAYSMLPPVLGAVDVNPEAIAKALGWVCEAHHSGVDGSPNTRLLQTKVRGENYHVKSAWDWDTKRFRVGIIPSGEVCLARLAHPAGRDHDIYRVYGKEERTFHSRNSAIIDAHAQAGVPFFHWDGEKLLRLAFEGSLPLEMATALRLRTLTNSGICRDGWGYDAPASEALWVARLLPSVVTGFDMKPAGNQITSFRRGRGARRPLWVNGRAVA